MVHQELLPSAPPPPPPPPARHANVVQRVPPPPPPTFFSFPTSLLTYLLLHPLCPLSLRPPAATTVPNASPDPNRSRVGATQGGMVVVSQTAAALLQAPDAASEVERLGITLCYLGSFSLLGPGDEDLPPFDVCMVRWPDGARARVCMPHLAPLPPPPAPAPGPTHPPCGV